MNTSARTSALEEGVKVMETLCTKCFDAYPHPGPLPRGWPLPTSQTAGHRRYSKRLQYRAKLAPNVCHNPVGVDPDLSSFTQGRLADSPTLGFEAQSLWDWRDARALTREPRPGVQRRDLWDRLSPRGENSPKAFLRVEPLNRKRNIQHSTFNAQYRRGSRCRLRSGLGVECRMLNVFRMLTLTDWRD